MEVNLLIAMVGCFVSFWFGYWVCKQLYKKPEKKNLFVKQVPKVYKRKDPNAIDVNALQSAGIDLGMTISQIKETQLKIGPSCKNCSDALLLDVYLNEIIPYIYLSTFGIPDTQQTRFFAWQVGPLVLNEMIKTCGSAWVHNSITEDKKELYRLYVQTAKGK